MSDAWFRGVIEAMKNNGLAANAKLIEEATARTILFKYLAGVDKSGTCHILKLN